ncbi:MAG TPA: LCP family protein [Mycobacterium sp.]|nr:LCP family protein [Mycobacterium sp.]
MLRRKSSKRRPALPPPPRRAPRPAAPKRRRHRHCRPGRLLAVGLLLAVLSGAAGIIGAGVWFNTALRRIPALMAYPDRPAPGHGTTWLLVGSDSRQELSAEQQQRLATGGDVGAGRTDTLLLIHLPGLGADAPATVVSIPRDSYVPIPGYGRDKINAAFALGGAPLLAQTVESATGLRLDHYAEIGFGGFARLVDALGGITMCPTEPLSDPLAGLDLPAGCQRLDGRAALGYVRTRATPRADQDRVAQQRTVLSALQHRATSPAVWLNPWRWYAVPRAASHAIAVDRGEHLWGLARLGWALHGAPITLTVPIGEFSTTDSGDVVVWDHEAASRLFDALNRDAPVPSDAFG